MSEKEEQDNVRAMRRQPYSTAVTPSITTAHTPLNLALDSLTALNDLRERLLTVTPAQIAAATRRLEPKEKGEVVIGTVTAPITRALHTLTCILRAEYAMQSALAVATVDKEIEDDLNEKGSILNMLSDFASELFWIQAKLDIGIYSEEHVGLRADWSIVRCRNQGGPGEMFATMFRGKFPPVE